LNIKNNEKNIFKFNYAVNNSIRNDAIPILLKLKDNNLTQNSYSDSINKWVIATKTFINKNPNILFTRADKGNVTVALDKNEYTHRMETMLSDKNTYTEVKKDPINKLTTVLRSLLTKWKNNDYIDVFTEVY